MRALCLLGALLLAACATPVEHATPGRHPEVTIAGAQVPQVEAELTSRMVDFGYHASGRSGALAFERHRFDGIPAYLVYGSGYDRTPNARVSYTLDELRGSVRVAADINQVERARASSRSRDALAVQSLLRRLEHDLAVATPADVAKTGR